MIPISSSVKNLRIWALWVQDQVTKFTMSKIK